MEGDQNASLGHGEGSDSPSRKDPAKSPPPKPKARFEGYGSYPAGSCGSCYWRRVKAQFQDQEADLCTLMPPQQLVIPATAIGKKSNGGPSLDPRAQLLAKEEAFAVVINVQVVRAFPPIEDLDEEGCVMWNDFRHPPKGSLVPEAT